MLTAVAIGILAERRQLTFEQVVGDIIRICLQWQGKNHHLAPSHPHLGHSSTPASMGQNHLGSHSCAIAKMPIESGWIPGEKAGYHIGTSWLILGEIVRRLDGEL